MKAAHFDSLQFGQSDHAARSARFAAKLVQINTTKATLTPAALDAIAAQDVEFVKPGAAFSFEAETK